MIFAIDKDGKRIHIDQTYVKNTYFCPVCGEELVIRKGNIRRHHFAHAKTSNCTDSWHYDMSEWHQEWQNRFPRECQEVVMIYNDKKHRADVFVNNTVIEFQHSPLSSEEFDDRNNFYTSLGYKVIWVFDLGEEFEAKKIEEVEGKKNIYRWKHPKSTFNNIDSKDKRITLFFEFGLIDEGWDTESKSIVKVTWASNKGFEWFATDGKLYTEYNFLPNSSEKKYSHFNACNSLYGNHDVIEKGNGFLFHGCPISENGFAISGDEKLGKEYGYCSNCRHNANNNCCQYPIDYLNIQNDAVIKEVEVDEFGLITSITYEFDGKIINGKLPKRNYETKNIYDLWDELTNPSMATFLNLRTRKYIRINYNPREQFRKFGKVRGKISSDRYSFKGEITDIFYCDRKEWFCVWHKS